MERNINFRVPRSPAAKDLHDNSVELRREKLLIVINGNGTNLVPVLFIQIIFFFPLSDNAVMMWGEKLYKRIRIKR